MLTGSCLCRAVRWRYSGTFDLMTHCHCGMCRKAHGTAFATYVMGPREPFVFDTGESAIRRYESSPRFIRSFCAHCGSVVPNTHLGERMAAPAGGFDSDPGIRPAAHIFVSSRAPWDEITDGLPRHDYYPGAAAPAVERIPPPASRDGRLRGSCLCGTAAYAVTGGFKSVHHCHCLRCRKARAAAHSTNGLTGPEGVQFTRGEAALVTYHHPETRFFFQVFCAQCGSKLPYIDASQRWAVVPFGSLDDDPERSADNHLSVDSKACWFEISDSLPRYQGRP
jgi:hypothetical protein